jgi:hypothetical protein
LHHECGSVLALPHQLHKPAFIESNNLQLALGDCGIARLTATIFVLALKAIFANAFAQA